MPGQSTSETMDASPAGNARRWLKRLLGSPFVWILPMALALDLMLGLVKPLDRLPWYALKPAHRAQKSLSYKMRCIRHQASGPELLLLGSSLPMAAAYYSDTRQYPGELSSWLLTCVERNLDPVMAYPQARYLEKCISASADAPLRVLNLTASGCMASDALLVLNSVLESGRRPALVVLAVAPRDFMDNLAPEWGKTPFFSLLGGWKCVSDAAAHSASGDTVRELLFSSASSAYRERNNMKSLLAAQAGRLLRRPAVPEGGSQAPPSRAVSKARQQREAGLPAATRDVLSDYDLRYNPPNYARFNQEIGDFRAILSRLRLLRIPVVVVNMPIGIENRALINSALLARFDRETRVVSAEQNADFIDLAGSGAFNSSDFQDSVHTTRDGAAKLVERLTAALKTRLPALASGGHGSI